jgi:hypothetical protein
VTGGEEKKERGRGRGSEQDEKKKKKEGEEKKRGRPQIHPEQKDQIQRIEQDPPP